MSGTTWSKFFWADWESEQPLMLSSLAAQGLWMRLLCIAAKSDPIGYVTMNGRTLGVTDIARLAGVTETEASSLIDELERNGVFSRDRTGRIYSRRMVRESRRAATARKNGRKGGNPSLSKDAGNSRWDKAGDNHEDKPHKPYANSQKSSEPKEGSGGEPAESAQIFVLRDDRTILFQDGLRWLASATGQSERSCRGLLGGWLKTTGDDAGVVLEALRRAQAERVADPVPWMVAALKPRPKKPGAVTSDGWVPPTWLRATMG